MNGRRLTLPSRRGSALVTVLIIVMVLGFTIAGVVGRYSGISMSTSATV